MADPTKTVKRTVKMKSFVWRMPFEDYDGSTRWQQVDSKAGEEIELPETVAAYGDSIGAFVTPEDEAAEAALTVDVGDLDDDELTDWVSEHTIPEIVTVAKNDPSLVSRLLTAENTATGNDPRSGLVDGLAIVAGSGEEPVEVETEGEEPTEPTEPVVEEDVDTVAKELGVDVAEVEGSGDEGAVTADDVKEYYDENEADATDGAVELAEEKDVYLADLVLAGNTDRISKDDVQAYLDAQEAASE